MTTMVERVARALCVAGHIPEGCGWTDDEKREFADEHWRAWEKEARAAIQAMREPTDAMIEAGAIATKDVSRDDQGRRVTTYLAIDRISAAYRSQIDAALAEQP